MANMLATTYKDCKNLLDNSKKNTIKIGNNTNIEYDEDMDIVVKYHGNRIIILLKNGDVLISLAGWPTTTTKIRINKFIYGPSHVYTKNGVTYLNNKKMDMYEWYLINRKNIYANGIS